VEREAQLDSLRRLGCGSAQGFLFAPPLTAAEMSELLVAERRQMHRGRRVTDARSAVAQPLR
jgi:EAL domain-containing protein (putative c-di-GMP-specific phosphodiesterase class I)